MLLVAALGALFFGPPEFAARLPASALIAVAIVVLAGLIYLQGKGAAASAGFALLVVLALFLFGYAFLYN